MLLSGIERRNMSIRLYTQQHRIEDRYTTNHGHSCTNLAGITNRLRLQIGSTATKDGENRIGRKRNLINQQSGKNAVITVRMFHGNMVLIGPINTHPMPGSYIAVIIGPNIEQRPQDIAS